jgi:hypothetical protein
MPLKLNDLLKKAEKKGITQKISAPSSSQLLRTWQQESVLYQSANQGTTREQLENSQGTSQGTSRERQENDKRTTREQPGEQPGNQPGNEPENKPGNKLGNKLGNTLQEKIFLELTRLSGLQEKLFNYALELCLSKDSSCTGFISTFEMANIMGCSYESAKVTLKRLIKKGLIIRLKGKASKGGFINLEIPKEIKLIALDIKKSNGLGNKPGNKLGNNPGNEPGNNLGNNNFLNNSSLINTTIENEEWNLNFEPLAYIGFTKESLMEIVHKNARRHTPQVIQEAIYAFAHDLEKKVVKIRQGSTPLQFFIGVMISSLYNPVSVDYINPEEQALQIYLERRQAAKERNKKVDDELRTEHFNQWEQSITEEERDNILPEDAKNSPVKSHARSCLTKHHRENVWPMIRNEFYKEKNLPVVEFIDD